MNDITKVDGTINVISEQEILNHKFNIYGTFTEPYFLAKDVASWLSIVNVSDMISRIDDDEVTRFNLGGLQGECNFLTENGLYEVLMQSRKPIAKKFKKEVKNILHEIRLNGEYKVDTFKIPQTLYLDKYKNEIKPVILKEVEPLISKGSGQKRKRVLCKCGYCGKEFIAQKYSITSGKTKSCGCLQIYATKSKFTIHGDSFSRLNNIFRAMKRRCYNKNCKDYKNYGGRGIKVEFNGYAEFKKWAEDNGYNKNLTIERKDVNKNYNKENCTWIKNEDQSLNKTNTIYVNYKGNSIALCLLCRNKNLNYHTVWQRIYVQHKSLYDSLY